MSAVSATRGVPTGLSATRCVVDGREVVVFSYPLTPSEDRLAELTDAEREVVLLALRGLSNADIAAARQTSQRTVSKQLDAAYRRLGVHSRRELAALLF
ncbi:MAG: helix-turn-helix transcriptional regulator [Sandaracinaceae bacterium]|nr:helix-turn-helix transcriptional regulator [Sandaracinaceae bacterium]